VPIFEFACQQCGRQFEELVAAASTKPPCPDCGSRRVRKGVSGFAVTGEARQAGGHACSGCGSGGGHGCAGCGHH